jgi:phosphatidylinositol dimannoside acyltransferase
MTTGEMAYLVGWRVVRLLPERLAYWIFDRIADYTWRRNGRLVRQLEANLRRATDDPRAVAREGMRMYLRYWCDAFRLPDWTPERITSSVIVHDGHNLTDSLRRGGVVVALPHMGNWDHAGAWAALTHGTVVSVAERLKPDSLYERFLKYRQRLGMEILAHDDLNVVAALEERLRSGLLVALLADRDLSRSGIEVDLLGEATTFPAGPARLAASTGSMLIPVSSWREQGHLHIHFHPPVDTSDIRVAAQKLADHFSVAIRQHPEEWHVLQRVFLADRRASAPGRSGQG